MQNSISLKEVVIVLVVLLIATATVVGLVGARPVRTTRRHINCAGNQKQIGLALLMYSGDFDGFFPNVQANGTSNFEPLVSQDYVDDGRLWACPLREEKLTTGANSAYVYVGSGLKDDHPAATTTTLAGDRAGNHPRPAELYIDGHVEIVDWPRNWEVWVQKLKP